MLATIVKETEKAICLTYNVEVSGELLTLKNIWWPKSCISLQGEHNGKTIVVSKYEWMVAKKAQEYCKRCEELAGKTLGVIFHGVACGMLTAKD